MLFCSSPLEPFSFWVSLSAGCQTLWISPYPSTWRGGNSYTPFCRLRALGTKPSWIGELIGALLQAADANVIAVDWVQGATAAYHNAVENVTKLALEITAFIRQLLVGSDVLLNPAIWLKYRSSYRNHKSSGCFLSPFLWGVEKFNETFVQFTQPCIEAEWESRRHF